MRFRIDFMSMPLHIRRARFRQFQLLAFSKGIIWGSGRNRPYTIKILVEFGKSMAGIKKELWSNEYKMFSLEDKDIPIIDIKEALKQLKEYNPDETTKIDKGTVQDTYASTTATSNPFSQSVIGGAIFTSWGV